MGTEFDPTPFANQKKPAEMIIGNGAEVVIGNQAHIRPHIILDKAQPNFLDPAGAGKVVMGQVFSASKGLLPW